MGDAGEQGRRTGGQAAGAERRGQYWAGRHGGAGQTLQSGSQQRVGGLFIAQWLSAAAPSARSTGATSTAAGRGDSETSDMVRPPCATSRSLSYALIVGVALALLIIGSIGSGHWR